MALLTENGPKDSWVRLIGVISKPIIFQSEADPFGQGSRHDQSGHISLDVRHEHRHPKT